MYANYLAKIFLISPACFVKSPVCAGGSTPSNPFLFVLSFCLVCALGAKGLGLTTSTICPEGLVFVVNTFVVSKPHVYTLLFLLFNPTYHYCLFLVYLLVFTKPMPSAIRLHVFSSFTRFHLFSLLLVQNLVYCSQLHFTLIDSFILFVCLGMFTLGRFPAPIIPETPTGLSPRKPQTPRPRPPSKWLVLVCLRWGGFQQRFPQKPNQFLV